MDAADAVKGAVGVKVEVSGGLEEVKLGHSVERVLSNCTRLQCLLKRALHIISSLCPSCKVIMGSGEAFLRC